MRCQTLFGVTPTGLDTGSPGWCTSCRRSHLTRVSAHSRSSGSLPESIGSRYDAAELLTQFRTHFEDVMPIAIGVEPVAPRAELVPGRS